MSRSGMFGWSLPPGCTQRHIDEAYGYTEEEEPMDKPNIVPCIAVEVPPLALDILIEAVQDHVNSWDNSGVDNDDPDLKMRVTLLNLLREIRLDYNRQIKDDPQL